jgi:hypothetical protein
LSFNGNNTFSSFAFRYIDQKNDKPYVEFIESNEDDCIKGVFNVDSDIDM